MPQAPPQTTPAPDLGVMEAAEMLGVSPKTLTRMCDDEEIAYYEYPHGRRFLSADIEAFLARARRPAKEASTP